MSSVIIILNIKKNQREKIDGPKIKIKGSKEIVTTKREIVQNSKSGRMASNTIILKIDNKKKVKRDSYIKISVQLKKAIVTYNADDIDERVKKTKVYPFLFPKIIFLATGNMASNSTTKNN